MSKKKGFKVLALALTTALAFSLGGCAKSDSKSAAPAQDAKASAENGNAGDDANKSSDKKVTIRLAHTYTGADAKAPLFAEMLKKFKEQNPNIEVVEETSSGDELRTKIKVDLASNNLPDIITYWGGSILQPLVDNDKVLDIDEYLKISKTLKAEDISDAAWQFYTFNGVKYGVPMEGYMSAFIVNKDLFKKYNLEYPKTQKELLEIAKVFNENGVVPLAVGSKGGNPSHFYFSELYNQFAGGTEEINNLGTTKEFATDNALKTAKVIDEQRQAGVFPKDTIANGDWSPSFELYNNGSAAMVYTYPWMLGAMTEETANVSEIIPLPKMDGAEKDPAAFVQSSSVFGLVINKSSFEDADKQQAIATLMDFLTSEDMFKELAKGGMVPTRNVQLDLSTVNPMMKRTYEYTEKLDKVPAHFNTISDDASLTIFQNTLDELFAGSLTPEEFVQKVQGTFDKAK